MEHVTGAPRANSLTFHYQILIESQRQLRLLGQSLQVSLFNPYWKPIENAPGTPLANSLTFPYQICIKRQWKMLLELPGPIPSDFLVKPFEKSMEHAPRTSWANTFKLPD